MKTLRIFLAILALTFSTLSLAVQVNINTADAQTMSQHIRGIGLKKAHAIIQYRLKNGKFKTVQDLVKVKGIGPKLIQKNKDVLTTETK